MPAASQRRLTAFLKDARSLGESHSVPVHEHHESLNSMLHSAFGNFPGAGHHPTAFMGLASFCELGYGHLCGETVENRFRPKNPNNADILCPPEAFERAVRCFT